MVWFWFCGDCHKHDLHYGTFSLPTQTTATTTAGMKHRIGEVLYLRKFFPDNVRMTTISLTTLSSETHTIRVIHHSGVKSVKYC